MLQEFISNARLLVNTLGYNKLFDTLEESSVGQQNEPTCSSINAARGAAAKGLVVADGFAGAQGIDDRFARGPQHGRELAPSA